MKLSIGRYDPKRELDLHDPFHLRSLLNLTPAAEVPDCPATRSQCQKKQMAEIIHDQA